MVEIDGIHHTWADQLVPDALRQNALTLEGATVLRLPLLGLPGGSPTTSSRRSNVALRRAGWLRAA